MEPARATRRPALRRPQTSTGLSLNAQTKPWLSGTEIRIGGPGARLSGQPPIWGRPLRPMPDEHGRHAPVTKTLQRVRAARRVRQVGPSALAMGSERGDGVRNSRLAATSSTSSARRPSHAGGDAALGHALHVRTVAEPRRARARVGRRDPATAQFIETSGTFAEAGTRSDTRCGLRGGGARPHRVVGTKLMHGAPHRQHWPVQSAMFVHWTSALPFASPRTRRSRSGTCPSDTGTSRTHRPYGRRRRFAPDTRLRRASPTCRRCPRCPPLRPRRLRRPRRRSCRPRPRLRRPRLRRRRAPAVGSALRRQSPRAWDPPARPRPQRSSRRRCRQDPTRLPCSQPCRRACPQCRETRRYQPQPARRRHPSSSCSRRSPSLPPHKPRSKPTEGEDADRMCTASSRSPIPKRREKVRRL